MFLNKIGFLLGLIVAVALTACGQDDDDFGGAVGESANVKTENLSFEFSEDINGRKCTTGKRSFDNKDKYCEALQQGKENQYCMEASRRNLFKSNCDGEFKAGS